MDLSVSWFMWENYVGQWKEVDVENKELLLEICFVLIVDSDIVLFEEKKRMNQISFFYYLRVYGILFCLESFNYYNYYICDFFYFKVNSLI